MIAVSLLLVIAFISDKSSSFPNIFTIAHHHHPHHHRDSATTVATARSMFTSSSSPPSHGTEMRQSKNSHDDIIDLQPPHFRRSPAEVMESITNACTTLGVQSFDVYGDFTKGKKRYCVHAYKLNEFLQHHILSFLKLR
mmetsp:Transcript_38090/g.55932  ORF Transcript_38090/g.55932 Transcript_38090/m.55932 type:complete len:139 (+) Transcript_38090:124-540(+)